jgi:hypothetical protein
MRCDPLLTAAVMHHHAHMTICMIFWFHWSVQHLNAEGLIPCLAMGNSVLLTA